TYSGVNESSGYITGLDMKLFGEFVPGSDSWLTVGVIKSAENLRGVTVPVANERRYNVSLFFTDYLPRLPKLKLSLRGVFMDGLLQSAPHSSRDKGYFRTPPYKRIDLGLAYGLLTPDRANTSFRWIKSAWIGVDCFNLLDISNVGNYYWVSDVNNVNYAVPNYLTRRLLNIKLSLEF
ncbi:MAG: TonB-dependent receptor, partial [Paramuribaculum sp.]|nr:TonB-dependent receptor [Paramuribaculum sp.]